MIRTRIVWRSRPGCRQRGSVSVVVAAVVLLALVLSVGVADVGRVLVARSHARTAADAAALAVTQELVLPTGTDPADVAAWYAGRNGAELTGCSCEAGSLEATVSVSVGVDGFLLVAGLRTVTARARAVVDLPSALPSPSQFSWPVSPLRLKVRRFAAENGMG